MNPDVVVKQHIQILGALVVAILIFGNNLILGNLPKDILIAKGEIKALTDQKTAFETLLGQKQALAADLEELRPSFQRLFEKFPNDENTENDINSALTKITSKIIVNNEKLKPKVMSDYVAEGIVQYSVPKVLPADPDKIVEAILQVATYEDDMEIRCNYFEFLQFVHDLANLDIFFTPMDIDLQRDSEAPYGITAKLRLLTFGFDSLKKPPQ